MFFFFFYLLYFIESTSCEDYVWVKSYWLLNKTWVFPTLLHLYLDRCWKEVNLVWPIQKAGKYPTQRVGRCHINVYLHWNVHKTLLVQNLEWRHFLSQDSISINYRSINLGFHLKIPKLTNSKNWYLFHFPFTQSRATLMHKTTPLRPLQKSPSQIVLRFYDPSSPLGKREPRIYNYPRARASRASYL